MATTVRARVFRKNAYEFPLDCPHVEAINCANATLQDSGWYTPINDRGRMAGYSYSMQAAKPTNDSIRVARIKDRQSGVTYMIALLDAESPQLFNDKCNACCDAVTDMSMLASALPDPFLELVGCFNTATTKFEAFWNFPALTGALVYKPKGSQDGVALTPLTPGAGFATVALFITWANTNWSAYGTWSNTGQMVKLSKNTAHRTWLDPNPA